MYSTAGERVIGIYLRTKTVVSDPGYLDALKRDSGLNLVILSGGYTLSPDVADLNPLGVPGQGPGFSWEADGTSLERAITLAHERDIRVWLLLGCWQIGAERYPNLVAQDMWGKRLTDYPPFPHCSEQRSLTFCPSNEAINAFYLAAYADIARRYQIDGIDLTHARYTSPAFWPAIFSCACARCGALAESLGFDWSRLRNDSIEAIAALQRIDAATLRRFADPGIGLGDFLQFVAGRHGIVDWLDFRAEVIARGLRRFHAATHQAAADRPFVFGADNFPPSVAIFAGHRYADFRIACDYTSPLLSHPAYFVLATIQSWAKTLMTWASDLSDAEALTLIYRVLGLERLSLPKRIAQLGDGLPASEPEVPGLEELVQFDLLKSRLYNTGAVPSYPVLMGGHWHPKTVRQLTDAAFEIGHDGVIYQQSEALTSYIPRPADG